MLSVGIKVLLCTGASSETDNNENHYIKCLTVNGFECKVLQVLNFEFVNLDELQNLLSSECYSGLILTSPRAATALALTKNKLGSIGMLLELPTFCIGEATESVARDQVGLSDIRGTSSGNAKNLANFILDSIKQQDCKEPLLLPCSDIARDTIPTMLSEKGFKIKKIVVYKTKAHERLREALAQALERPPDVFVFFSPSIVDNLLDALVNDKSVFEKARVVAIGPVTEQALLSAGFKVHAVSEKPEPRALAQAIGSIV